MVALKTCMRYIFILSTLIFCGIFATDWWFRREGGLLNDTLVGVMIGAPIGWFGAIVAYYTTEKVSDINRSEVADGAGTGKDTGKDTGAGSQTPAGETSSGGNP